VVDKAAGTPNPQLTQALCNRARESGLILLSCGFYGNAIRCLVPITVEPEVLEEGLAIIEQSLVELIEPRTAATA